MLEDIELAKGMMKPNKVQTNQRLRCLLKEVDEKSF